jgi:integrase
MDPESGRAPATSDGAAAATFAGLRRPSLSTAAPFGGLSLDDTDEDGTILHVQRQIRVVDRTLVFALPKGGKKRRVPLSRRVLAGFRAHERAFPSAEVTLPWVSQTAARSRFSSW